MSSFNEYLAEGHLPGKTYKRRARDLFTKTLWVKCCWCGEECGPFVWHEEGPRNMAFHRLAEQECPDVPLWVYSVRRGLDPAIKVTG